VVVVVVVVVVVALFSCVSERGIVWIVAIPSRLEFLHRFQKVLLNRWLRFARTTNVHFPIHKVPSSGGQWLPVASVRCTQRASLLPQLAELPIVLHETLAIVGESPARQIQHSSGLNLPTVAMSMDHFHATQTGYQTPLRPLIPLFRIFAGWFQGYSQALVLLVFQVLVLLLLLASFFVSLFSFSFSFSFPKGIFVDTGANVNLATSVFGIISENNAKHRYYLRFWRFSCAVLYVPFSRCFEWGVACICRPPYAGRHMQAAICRPPYAGRHMQVAICRWPYAGIHCNPPGRACALILTK